MDHFRNNTLAEGSLLPIDRLAQFPPISLRHTATRSARISTPAPSAVDRSTPLLCTCCSRPFRALACRRLLRMERKNFFSSSIRKSINLFRDTRKGRGNCNLLRFSRKMMMLLFIFGGNLFIPTGSRG